MAVMTGLGLSEFTAADGERIFAPLEAIVDKMVDRDIDMLMQSGMPPALLLGVEGHDRMIERMAARTDKPVQQHDPGAVRRSAAFGIENIVLANKWSDEMNATLAAFFARAGVSIAGSSPN